jgi:hypothetical protein
MTERATFPSPPTKSGLLARDGTMALAWLAWVNALTGWVQRVRVFSIAVDVPSIPAGGTAFVDFTIPGAAIGDFAWVSFDPFNADLTVLGADVRLADTVRVRIQNFGAGAVDLAAGTARIRLEKAR